MSRDHKIDRKQFLTWSLAAAGGVMIGCTSSESGSPDAGGAGSTGTSGSGGGSAGAAGGSTGTAGSTGGSTGSTGGSGGSTGGTTGAIGGNGGATGGTTGATGGSGGSTGAAANCSTSLKVTITSNHGHVLVVTLAEIMAGKTKVYDTRGITPGTTMPNGHTHFIQFTAADYSNLAAGKEVRKPSCNADHEHEFIVNCLGTDGVGMPNVAAFCGSGTDPNRTCGDTAVHTCPDGPYPAN